MLKTINHKISAILIVFSLFISTSALAHVNFDVNIGVGGPVPVPPAAVVMVAPPQGFQHCYMTQGMWYNDVWVPAHQQCEYVGPDGPQVWVSGYWGCTNVGPGGYCGHWRWYGHRMMHRNVVAYEDHFHGGYHEGPRYANGPAYAHGPSYREEVRVSEGGPRYGHRGGPRYGNEFN
jgi:hypothetical protein